MISAYCAINGHRHCLLRGCRCGCHNGAVHLVQGELWEQPALFRDERPPEHDIPATRDEWALAPEGREATLAIMRRKEQR